MKILAGRICPLITAGALLAVAAPAFAQEFFREFGTSRSSGGIGRLTPSADVFSGNNPSGLSPVDSVDQSAVEDKYNFRLGLVDFVVAAGLGVEFNDNITLSSSNELSDIIVRPEVNIEGILRVSELNTLRFGIGIGYAKYINHSEFDSDSVIVSPTSSIVWTAKAGNVTFTVRERLSYQEDPFALPVLSNVANYRRWENQAGIEIDWEATEYARVSVGFDRFDLWAKDSTFSAQDRSINTVFVRPSVDINPHVTVGLNGSVSWVDYKENVQADGKTLLVGPYVQVKVSDVTDIYAEVGWQKSEFDGATQQLIAPVQNGVAGTPFILEDNEDSESIYFKAQITNRPTEHFRHSLTASRTTESGLGSNFYELYHFEYTADWNIADTTSITPTAFYELYETSGNAPEKAHRLGLALGIHHIISNSLTVGLDYRFLKKDSNRPDSDYKQNLGMLSLYYKF
jgi:hypothetical protein